MPCPRSEVVVAGGGDEEAATEDLSALLTSCFNLGQFVGPLGGALLASRFGFRVASDVLTLALVGNALWLLICGRRSSAADNVSCTEVREKAS